MPIPPTAQIHALVLAGGHSTRMGSPKWLLKLPDNQPLYVKTLNILRNSLPVTTSRLYISLRNEQQAEGTLLDPTVSGSKYHENLIFDQPPERGTGNRQTAEEIGPAAGLLAAHRFRPEAYWLVLAVDYPLMSVEEMKRLVKEYFEPVTCFQNEDGFAEPLVGLWSPRALEALAENVAQGRTGPSRTVRQLGGCLVKPLSAESLTNANTPEEWEGVLNILRQREGGSRADDAQAGLP